MQTTQTWAKLNKLQIKKLHAEIDVRIGKMVSCHFQRKPYEQKWKILRVVT